MCRLSWFLALLFCFSILEIAKSFQTGFWYSKNASAPPDMKYDSVAYANITVKVNRPNNDGPGRNLVTDPFRVGNDLYTGNTIFRQTFDTQFVLDVSSAIGINVDRIFVTHVIPGYVHFSWEASNVIVYFVIIERNSTSDPTLLEALAEVTNQVQNSSSLMFQGNVTRNIDPYWGIQVVNWDISLRLNYAIEVVGGDEVIDGYYLNQGGLGICNLEGAQNYPVYCEFERFFEDDIADCLSISPNRVQLMFVKKAALDQVLVHFRILPSRRDSTEANVTRAIANLLSQVHDLSSDLYKGNVTLRVDPQWGISETLPTQRTQGPLFTQSYYRYSRERLEDKQKMLLMTAYDRCKANRRCNWGVVSHDQSTNNVKYYQQLFDRGKLYDSQLFLDFEDWRLGARSFNMEGVHAPSNDSTVRVRGAHFDIFTLDSIGADVPSFLGERNQGLVLDRLTQRQQLDYQEALVNDLKGEIDWMEQEIETATMSAKLRARKDVRASMQHEIISTTQWWKSEVNELNQLNSSQCVQTSCYLLFNTSSLSLTGAISGKGVLRYTANGTEVAVFTFNSIYLGPEVKITLVGQRALALVSKTSAVINTTFRVDAGTLGGFKGGGIVGRLRSDALNDDPRPVFLCELYNYCPPSNSTLTSAQRNDTAAVNVNGPGSGGIRLYAFDIATIASDRREIQVISTSSDWGQTIRGGFVLHYRGHSTPVIPHDCSSDELKAILEENLNLQVPADLPVETKRTDGRLAGIGIVEVTRTTPDQQGGYNWTVTFSTSIGNMDQMTATSYLYGVNSTVSVSTIQQANEVGGTFKLRFQDHETAPISARETAAGMKQKLLQLPSVVSAYVSRYDPIGNCDDGQCEDGPLPWGGLVWSVYLGTNASSGDVIPMSPAAIATIADPEVYMLTADSMGLTGANASIEITWGNVKSRDYLLSLLKIRGPYSLAFGGAGASYGGQGGAGYNDNPTGQPYNDERITDLLGGSGGCVRSPLPFELNALYNVVPTGLGGNGGGAIEIIAANDIVIGTFGQIIARGSDGESQSGAGSGGGSGGAVVLAAGASIYHQGLIDAGGGAGGYSGGGRSGGGGGGGRVAMYAESIVQPGKTLVKGGPCGGYKIPTSESVLLVNVTVEMWTPIWLGHSYVSHLGEIFVNHSVSPIRTETLNITSDRYVNGTDVLFQYLQTVEMSFRFNGTANDSNTFAANLKHKFDKNLGYRIAELIMWNATINGHTNGYYKTTTMLLGFGEKCNTNGQDGTIFTEAQMNTSMLSLVTTGAEGTKRALLLSNRGDSVQFSTANGPITSFNASQPTRVTYYIRMSAVPENALKKNFGALFTLISRKEDILNVSQVIGVFIGERIMHGANFGSSYDPNVFYKKLYTIGDYSTFDSWYKVDIHINWPDRLYKIFLNDYLVVFDQKFDAKSVDGIRLSVTRLTEAWFDEIYVGFDNMMDFTCPTTNRRGTSTVAPAQETWDFEEVHGEGTDGYTEYYKMTRHYNHLDTSKTVHFDGNGHVKDFQDIPLRLGQGDYLVNQGILHAGTLVYLENSLRTGRSPTAAEATTVSPRGLWNVDPSAFSNAAGDGRQYWYTEYTFESNIDPTLSGGVAACSSQDMKSWRFEGIIIHYVNLTDTVYGYDGSLVVERPKILWNNATKNFVMWAVMEDTNRTLAMNVVATSPYEDGPFLFRRSFYPDGNMTRDQVIFVNDEQRPVLARTYYQTVEFLLPAAIMQPVWESVKNRDGTTNYRNNYHRAKYHIGYDYYHDIFNQRWRKEDKAWSVKCVNRITGVERDIPYGSETAGESVCIDPDEYKVIEGQGVPVVKTHFVSPNNSDNSWWMQTSVPAVKAQSWASSYRDGYCGIRKLDNGYDIYDPILEDFTPPDLGTCSNIADNPIHETLQDKLIGAQKIIYTRRAKYVAISELTYDYLDTTGNLVTFEGELQAGRLVTLIPQNGQFGFGPGDELRSTFRPPMRSEFNSSHDWEYRFRQYLVNHNDRATYALACVLDGVCPVNFKDQITPGPS